MDIIKVASNSPTRLVAGAIANTYRDEGKAIVQAIGAGAVNQAVKSLIIAQRYLMQDDLPTVFVPEYAHLIVNGQERTAVRMVVIPDPRRTQEAFSEFTASDEVKDVPLSHETKLDYIAATADADAVREQAESYTEDEEIAADFAQRQKLAHAGRRKMLNGFEKHHATSPNISADDVDARWDQENVGTETVGGSAPTPDQDQVDEIGEAVGLTYEDDEPLNTAEKLAERDENRWSEGDKLTVS